jgi:hypothetical protein
MLDREGGQFQESPVERGIFYQSTKRLLGERDVEVILPLELDGDVWTLVVFADDEVALHRVKDETAETRFLGKGLHGDYVEALHYKDGEFESTFRFSDERLPGGVVELVRRWSPEPKPGVHEMPEARARREEIDKLAIKLRAWASAAES